MQQPINVNNLPEVFSNLTVMNSGASTKREQRHSVVMRMPGPRHRRALMHLHLTHRVHNTSAKWRGDRDYLTVATGGTPLPLSFEGVTGSVNVANMWADHFKGIFNDVSCDSDIEILNYFASAPSPTIPPISMEEVCNAVAKLKRGKAAGWDHMSSEHLLHLEPDVLSIIVVILNSILNHATVPDDVIFSLLQPSIKDKNQGRHFLKMIGRALMLIFTTSKPFLPCNAIGIMLKFRNYW